MESYIVEIKSVLAELNITGTPKLILVPLTLPMIDVPKAEFPASLYAKTMLLFVESYAPRCI